MLFVFGDSHAVIWGGRLVSKEVEESRFPLVKVHHLGPALAYNLSGDDGSPGKWGRAINEALEASPHPPSAIMLCFGEIDVRTQIVKRAIADGVSLDRSVSIVVERYFRFVDLLRERATVPIFLWGPIASTKDFGRMDSLYPVIGSEVERNVATLLFNAALREKSETRSGVRHLTINEHLIGHTWLTRHRYLEDGVHLNLEALDIAIDAFDSMRKRETPALPDYFAGDPSVGAARPAQKDISSSARIIRMSSNHSSEAPQGVTRAPNGPGYIFQTKKDVAPFIVVDIGFCAFVRRIRVFNRFDACQERARSLEVFIGNDGGNPRLVYRHSNGTFGLDGRPIELAIDAAQEPFRYIYLRLRESEHFHLGAIEIIADAFWGGP